MTEEDYDTIIAPMLAEVALKVKDLGGSIIARVEWEKDQAGITHLGVTFVSGVAQQLAYIAALARGNIDTVCIEAMKRFDCSQSLVLSQIQKSKNQ